MLKRKKIFFANYLNRPGYGYRKIMDQEYSITELHKQLSDLKEENERLQKLCGEIRDIAKKAQSQSIEWQHMCIDMSMTRGIKDSSIAFESAYRFMESIFGVLVVLSGRSDGEIQDELVKLRIKVSAFLDKYKEK
jgi:hypothetical protein